MNGQNPTQETAKAYAAFMEYCALGSGRSLAKLAQSNQQYAKSIPVLKRWSSQHNWQERVKVYDQERIEAKRQQHDAEIEAMNERHAVMGTTQQDRAVKQIEALIRSRKFGSQAAVQLLKLATDLERVARGAPTERSEVTGLDGSPLARIFIPDNGRDGYAEGDKK